MPLPNPILDDRSYQQLRDELVARIPVYAPEWTDHNPSDPGVALLELFAFLGESLLFRFNQIPEATKLAFLRLLDLPLRQAQPARTLVAMTSETPTGVLVARREEARAGKLVFETDVECMVWPLEGLAAAKLRAAPETGEERAWSTRVVDALGGVRAGEEILHYRTGELAAGPGKPGAPILDLGAAVDRSLWLALLSTRDTRVEALAGGLLNVGLIVDEDVLTREEVEACPGAGPGNATRPIVWQIAMASAGTAPVYRTLVPEHDTTRGLRRAGVVRLRLPAGFGLPADDEDLRGAEDRPPLLEDEALYDPGEARHVLTWLRAFAADGSELGRFTWVGLNASEVEHARSARPEFLGLGTGQPQQRVRLHHGQVLPGTLALEVEEGAGWQRWQQVDGFHASGESDLHYLLEPELGEVRFGSGVNGAAPALGRRIRAASYGFGGGKEGNVAAGAIDKLSGARDVKITNPRPARGGADAEALAQALERIPGELRRRDRAVTASDFRELARMTPGAGVARAEVLPLFHPRNPQLAEVPGVVSVVVWPGEDAKRPDAPLPDRTLLEAVCRFLDARRLITTELYVIPPRYRRIAVSVGVQVKPGYGIEAVRRWVQLVVHQYVAPLPPYGPSGQGWPLGRRVLAAELEAAALQVEGVEYLNGLRLAVIGADGKGGEEVAVVELERDEVVHLAAEALTVVAGEPPPPGTDLRPSVPGTPVPVPIVREEC